MRDLNDIFSLSRMMIVTFLMLFGFFFSIIFFINVPLNQENIINTIVQNIMPLTCLLFFIIIGLFSWHKYFVTVILKPKKSILYL